MNEKETLIDKLKLHETEANELKIELKSISSKLDVAYQYEEDLHQRQLAAKEKTEKLRIDFFKKSHELSIKFDDMKKILDIWTGNFYNQ